MHYLYGKYNNIINSFNQQDSRIFTLNAPDGTGKRYVVNLILSIILAKNQLALVSAISGITTTLLENERTLHSLYKITVNIT